MNNEELTKVIDNMREINRTVLGQNYRLHEELERSNKYFFWLAGVMTTILIIILCALW